MRALWRYIKLSVLVGLLPVALGAVLVGCVRVPEIPSPDEVLVPKIPSLDKILKREPPITTSLSDAVTEIPFLDDFDPEDLVPMTVLPRGPNGSFLLRPGLFELNAQSYCLEAGTYVPGGGDGYLYAPLKGPWADIVRNILRRSVDHSEIPQRDIQVLLWAIIARTKMSDMSGEMQLTAAKLLTPEEIFEINGGALGLIPEELLDKALERLPPQARQVLEAEARLREMLTETGATFEELERVAVLVGDAPPGEGSREVPRGRWSYHPDGYFIRYFPSSYSRTRVQLHVPGRAQIERDEQGRITLIADGNGNRIETQYDDAIEALTVPGDPDIRGYAFRSVRFARRIVIPPEVVLGLEAAWYNLGWTLIGVPSGEGHVESLSDRFPDLMDRYQWAKIHKKQLDELDEQFDPKGSIDDIMDLGHYTVALEKAISGDQAEKINWAADHIDVVKKAWQYAVCKREGGYSAEGTSFGSLDGKPEELTDPPMLLAASRSLITHSITKSNPEGNNGGKSAYDPSDNDAVPGDTSRQRLGISPRPSDDEVEKKRACEKIKNELSGEEALLKAFEDLDLLYQAEDEEWNVDKYFEEVKKRAIKDLGMEGQVESSDWEAPMEMNPQDCKIQYNWKKEKGISPEEALKKYIEEFGSIAGRELFDAHEAHEKEHVRQCGKYFPGTFGRCRNTIRCFRDSEIKAYKKGIDSKKKSLEELKCN